MKNINTILNKLKNLADADYKIFNNKIIPTNQKMLGVRMPILRDMAKQIAKKDPIYFIQQDKQNIYEMILLEGMVLSYMKKSFIEILPLVENFLEKVDNWAQVDSVICNFKTIKNDEENILEIIKIWLKSDKEFIVRAGLIMLLSHYLKKDNLNMIFNLSQTINHTGYYVYMGNAWLISVCMAKFPNQTIVFFKNNSLDKRTHNKAIQKSRESYRVSKENKILINQFKRI